MRQGASIGVDLKDARDRALVFDIEAYVAGHMLVYPPAEGRETAVGWGASVGVSVPLSAYLERL